MRAAQSAAATTAATTAPSPRRMAALAGRQVPAAFPANSTIWCRQLSPRLKQDALLVRQASASQFAPRGTSLYNPAQLFLSSVLVCLPCFVAGVELDATIAQVKAAYRQRVLASHPDKNPQAAADGGAKFQRVQAAYATLMSLAEQQQQQAATAQ